MTSNRGHGGAEPTIVDLDLPDGDQDERLEQLLEKSSLGTAGAKRLRERANREARNRTRLAASEPVVRVEPKTYNDARRIGELVRTAITTREHGQAVLVDLAYVDDEAGKRLVDFMAGLMFGCGGSFVRIEATVFLLEVGATHTSA